MKATEIVNTIDKKALVDFVYDMILKSDGMSDSERMQHFLKIKKEFVSAFKEIGEKAGYEAGQRLANEGKMKVLFDFVQSVSLD